jgi:hypothetical protein
MTDAQNLHPDECLKCGWKKEVSDELSMAMDHINAQADKLKEASVLLKRCAELLLQEHQTFRHPDGIYELNRKTELFTKSVQATRLATKIDEAANDQSRGSS